MYVNEEENRLDRLYTVLKLLVSDKRTSNKWITDRELPTN